MMRLRSAQYYRFIGLRGNIISAEGLIGAGKSTLCKALCEYLKTCGFEDVQYFPEDINMSFLQLYLRDMPRYAFSFQLSMLQNRIAIHREATALTARGGIAIIDRGFPGDIAFALMQCDKGFFTEEEWQIYLAQIAMAQLYEASVVLHLVCDAETSIDRVKIRDRTGESVYTTDYMEALHAATVKALGLYHRGPVAQKDWSHNLSASGYHDMSVSGNHVVEISDDLCDDILDSITEAKSLWYSEQWLKTLSARVPEMESAEEAPSEESANNA